MLMSPFTPICHALFRFVYFAHAVFYATMLPPLRLPLLPPDADAADVMLLPMLMP